MIDAPPRSIRSLRVHCWQCDAPEKWQGRNPAKIYTALDDDTRLSDDDIAFGEDGLAHCRRCDQPVYAHISGWNRHVRARCQGCDEPLAGRQIRWCAKTYGRWAKVCSIAWDNPALLYGELAQNQHGRCGICCGPLSADPGLAEVGLFPERPRYRHCGEVDHVEPVSKGGPGVLENLRATHMECNQFKKARPLADARLRMGLTATVIEERLADLPADVADMLRYYPKEDVA